MKKINVMKLKQEFTYLGDRVSAGGGCKAEQHNITARTT